MTMAAKIIDGKLCYNSALTAEIAILVKGPEEGRKAIMRFAKKRNAEADFTPHIKGLRLVPSELDRYAKALEITRLIGQAVGMEICRCGYYRFVPPGGYAQLFQAFRDGVVSGEDCGTTDGTLDGLFLDCGRTVGGILGYALPDDLEDMGKEAFSMFLENAFDAFTEGLITWQLAWIEEFQGEADEDTERG